MNQETEINSELNLLSKTPNDKLRVLKKYLKYIFIDIDALTFRGRSAQRFRLIGLPVIPVLIFLAVSIQQLMSYRNTLIGYQGMYDRARFRYTMSQLIVKLDWERSTFVTLYLEAKNESKRSEYHACVNRNNSKLLETIKESNEVLEAFLKLPYIPSEADVERLKGDDYKTTQTSSQTKVYLDIFRNSMMNSGPENCVSKFDSFLVVYTFVIIAIIRFSPGFYEAELSKLTFMHVFALQHVLEAHVYISATCYLASDYFFYGRFLNENTQFYMIGNYSLGIEGLNHALKLDEVIQSMYASLIHKGSYRIDEYTLAINSISNYENINVNFTQWYDMCRKVTSLFEDFETAISDREKREAFDVEYRNCLMGIIFYSLAILINIPSFVFIYLNSRTTVKSLRQFSSLFESQASKLLDEQEKTEALLSEMLPKSVARQLRLGNLVKAETFESSTVFFSDIVNFTEMTLIMEPIQVVDVLNAVYSLLDRMIDNFCVYKVETIGSVYMVVSGIPVRNGQQHVTEVADMSLDILETMEQQSFVDVQSKVELRIGVHTGPCVAGVVGNKMTRYCLFGDTVNTASRMQSTGMASNVHISETTFLLLDHTDKYNLKMRGPLEVKGKGVMTTYWLFGKKSKAKDDTEAMNRNICLLFP